MDIEAFTIRIPSSHGGASTVNPGEQDKPWTEQSTLAQQPSNKF
jgi:hypothetical protein